MAVHPPCSSSPGRDRRRLRFQHRRPRRLGGHSVALDATTVMVLLPFVTATSAVKAPLAPKAANSHRLNWPLERVPLLFG
jgi:hypothetical protein